jgi:hypothetical protein
MIDGIPTGSAHGNGIVLQEKKEVYTYIKRRKPVKDS